MKKSISFLLIAVLLICLPISASAAGGFGGLLDSVKQDYAPSADLILEPLDPQTILDGAAAGKRVTLMVYMCGSNLESLPQGSASKDIQEMISSAYDTDSINLIIMPGGARRWHTANINEKETGIYCVRPDGITKLWESGSQLNMGDPATLGILLDYGYRYFPADQYALIIWDHGGGSINGVCNDEITNDSLSMIELQDALNESPVSKTPLEWIGFDACLMASAEVSIIMAPFARYMIASEETEPGFGWDYHFLKGIEKDKTGAETGTRIVEHYLDWYGKNQPGSDITLSCVNLSSVSQLAEQIDAFFADAGKLLDTKGVNELAKAVHQAKFFGNTGVDPSDDDMSNAAVYDLADLGNLINCLDSSFSADGKALANYLHENVIVKSGSNLSRDVSGLTIYHPLRAKSRLRSNIETYRALGILPNYANYIEKFGKMLLEKPSAGFSGLIASFSDSGKVRRSLVSLPLNDEQAQSLVDYELIALQRSEEEETAYHLVSVSDKTALNKDGTLQGEFVFRNLFLTDADGEPIPGTAPLYYQINANGQYLIPATLCGVDPSSGEVSRFASYLVCEQDPKTMILRLVSVMNYDEYMESYTPRLSLDYDTVKSIEFDCIDRVPTRNTTGALMGFDQWKIGHTSTVVWDTADDYQLRFLDNRLDESSVYVAFSLTDAQSNQYLSELVPLNADVEAGVLQLSYDDKDQLILLSDPRCEAMPDVGFMLSVNVESIAEEEIAVSLRELSINGHKLSSEVDVIGMGPNLGLLPEESQTLLLLPGKKELAGIAEVDTISFTLVVSNAESGDELARIPVDGITHLSLH